MYRIAFAAALALSYPAIAGAQGGQAPDTVLVFDVSGSMWGRIDGRTKIEIAREAVGTLTASLPQGTRLGLVAYGHRRANDCSDIETVIAPAALDRGRIETAVARLTPRGRTPITAALREAARALDAEKKGGTIILVTDGVETCKGDPCALAAELKRKNTRLTAHVVGFDVARKGDQARLACIADRTGGTFVSASNAGELAEALRRTASAKPKAVAVTRNIRLKATADGKPVPEANFTIIRTSDEFVVAEDVRDAIALANGSYTVVALAGVRSGSASVEVTARAPSEIVVALTGALPKASVRPLSASAVATTEMEVAWEGPDKEGDYLAIASADGAETEERAYAWTRSGNPLKLRVPGTPGAYEVRYILAQPPAVLARARFTVIPATATLDAPQNVGAGTRLSVSWTGPRSEADYISIAKPGAANDVYESWASLPADGAPVTLHMPGEPGTYELRYVTGHEAQVLARRPITIGAVGATVSGPAQIKVAHPFSIAWTGPAGDGDFVAIAATDAPPDVYVSYRNALESPLPMKAPARAGAFELRYVQNAANGYKVLARSPIAVAAASVRLEAPERVRRGADVKVSFDGPRGEGDYISIAVPGAADDVYETWGYANAEGNVVIPAPEKPGTYEVRYVAATEAAVVLGRRSLRVD